MFAVLAEMVEAVDYGRVRRKNNIQARWSSLTT